VSATLISLSESPSSTRATNEVRRSDLAIALLMLEPVADASAEELGETRRLRLIPTEFGLEIARTRSLVLEQPVKRQPGSGHRHGDSRIIR
jgi:hypothetical protein